MKINLLTGFLALAVLTGCANLGTLLQPEVDPQLVATDATMKGAPNDIESFLGYTKANPHIIGMDTRVAAKGLTERYESNLLNLKNTRKLYAANRTDENKTLLLRAKESVDSDRGVALSHLNGYILGQRGQGAPFAPPMGSMPPAAPTFDPTGLYQQLAAQQRKQEAIEANLNRLAVRVWELTNTNSAATNAPPVPGK